VPGEEDPQKILVNDPGTPPQPVASLGVHSSSNGISFSTNEDFGFEGQAFIAQFGDMAPGVGKVLSPVGYRVVRADVETGIVEDFATNKAKKNGPASWLETGGLERPVSVQFSPDGTALYITDFGILATSKEGANPVKNSGVVWKITRQD
jgi:glucose/arabinose dehydrogenase